MILPLPVHLANGLVVEFLTSVLIFFSCSAAPCPSLRSPPLVARIQLGESFFSMSLALLTLLSPLLLLPKARVLGRRRCRKEEEDHWEPLCASSLRQSVEQQVHQEEHQGLLVGTLGANLAPSRLSPATPCHRPPLPDCFSFQIIYAELHGLYASLRER